MKSYNIENVTDVFELSPSPAQHQKSFYGKAKVYITESGDKYLTSYDEVICKKSLDGHITRIWTGWSVTTGRHIKAFCGLNKKEYSKCESDSDSIQK